MRRPTALIPFAFLALGVPAAAAEVHVVDAAGGGDFTDLPASVAAAAPGDILLVKDGSYSGFAIDDLSLTVAADSGSSPMLQGPIRIQNLSSSKRVVISGLLAVSDATNSALTLTDCAGEVLVEGSCFTAPVQIGSVGGEHAGRVRACSSVTLVDCTFKGATPFVLVGGGGHGVWAEDSTVYLDACVATGATGPPGNSFMKIWVNGGLGGAGLLVWGGSAVVFGGEYTGGDGGNGSPGIGTPCGAGGPGGDGIRLSLNASLVSKDVVAIAGSGGPATSPFCSGGPDGDGLSSFGGTSDELLPPARGFDFPHPIRENEQVTLAFGGLPGEFVFTLYGPNPAFLYLPELAGVVLFAVPFISLPQGTIDGSGSLLVPFTLRAFKNPLAEGATAFVQAAFFGPSGEVVLGPGRAVVLIDQAL